MGPLCLVAPLIWQGLPHWVGGAERAAFRGGGVPPLNWWPFCQASNDSAFTMTFGLKNKLSTIFKGNEVDRCTPSQRCSDLRRPCFHGGLSAMPPAHPFEFAHPFQFLVQPPSMQPISDLGGLFPASLL